LTFLGEFYIIFKIAVKREKEIIMIDVISSILEAEKKADEILKTANAESKAKILSADEQAEKIKADAIADFKTERKETLKKADAEAEKQYADRIEKGKAEAKAICDKALLKTDKTADSIVKEIIG